MSTRVRQALYRHLGELRHEPTEKRVRGLLGDHVVADTTGALLVWEPPTGGPDLRRAGG